MKAITDNLLLIQAEQLCEQRSVRMTPLRMEVLRLISQQNGAISAYDLLNLLRQSEPHAKPPTIYRALDFLREQRFIHRVESTNSFMLCHHLTEPLHTSVFFICDRCGLVTEQKTKNTKNIMKRMASTAGFFVFHTVMEVHGLCLSCHSAV
ncbi:zinc uptake transcriptional repressor Zur [Candidatus Hoaglandella endobia]|uniref:Zinc uptake regulation protein n=1 Tax=Candidatus Hoaglandella endobia TaxID=1778263 RepID=A0A143WUL4_9ENTR|nr:zinc uptake transcriptional repressor Zur [Candidatus Hoaglandella endobia]CUX97457.1 Zinc uptake regulation protein [Candidatus Hoaglandella endobia]